MDGLVEIFLFCGVLYYFFNWRANNMVDVLSTRLQEVYAKWESRTEMATANTLDATPRLSFDGLRRAGQQYQKRKTQGREQARKIRDNNLFKIKESEPLPPSAPPQIIPFLHRCCARCTPSSKNSLVSSVQKQYQTTGKNILIVDPGPSIVSRIFSHLSEIHTFKKYDYPKVTQTVLTDERLRDAIKQAADEEFKDNGGSVAHALAKAEARAKTVLLQMQSSLSDTLLRITVWILYKLLPCFIQSAIVQPVQIDMLKKANDSGLPLIFLPLHRSHLDYVMISFVLLSNDIRVPLIAAGDNLKIPFFGWMLSGLGAFYIKRRIDPILGRKDMLYRAVLHTYLVESLRAGHNVEFFIEGGRSRTGKPCMPKVGILSVILDAYMDGTIEDALIVPVSMNYERLVDGNFVGEQLGQPKKMETFGTAISAIWATLMGNYGIVKVDFSQPFSLREMLRSFQAQQSKSIAPAMERPLKSTVSSSSLYGTDVVAEEHRQLVDNIAKHVIHDCSKSTPIMSTNVVAFLLLNKFRDGCTLDRLVEAFDCVRHELEYGQKNIAFCGESIDIINHALNILGPGLVKQQRQEVTDTVEGQPIRTEVITAIRPVSILPNVIELSYYSNSMLVHYILDSVVVTALYGTLHSQINDPQAIANNNITVLRDTLVKKALKVCDILKYEFIFCRPCQDLESILIDTITDLTSTSIITLKEDAYTEDELWCRRYAATNLDDSSDEEYSVNNRIEKIEYKLNLEPEYSRRMEFLHTLLRPFVDTYTMSASTLRKLVGRSLTERDLLHEVLGEIKTGLDRGIVNYGESLCVDPIKNSFKLFEKWDVLECHPQENVKIYYLKEEYDNDEAANQIYESIATFKWTRNIE